MKADEQDTLFNGKDDASLNIDEAVVMNKYILAGMFMLDKADAKAKGMVSYPFLLKAQLKLNQTFG